MTPQRVGIFLLLSLFVSTPSISATYNPPQSLARAVLSETVPFTFAPNALKAKDFEIVWESQEIEGLDIQMEQGSLQWVRVGEVLVLPRARLKITTPTPHRGIFVQDSMAVPFQSGTNQSAFVSIALLSGIAGKMVLNIEGSPDPVEVPISIQLTPTISPDNRISHDSSCSPYLGSLNATKLASWMYIGCRLIHTRSKDYTAPTLELILYWDGANQPLQVNGLQTDPVQPGLWMLRVHPQETTLQLQKEKSQVTLSYKLPQKLRMGFLGLGVGPYQYRFSPTGDTTQSEVNNLAPLLTFYGSVTFTDTIRMVMFTALPAHRKLFADTGIYLHVEQTRTLDRRLSVNLLLGGHFLVFPYQRKATFRLSFPQGLEIVLRDIPGKNQYLSAGAFLHPLIKDRSYFNVWLRWGKRSLFGELNYISWQEKLPTGIISAEVVGISIGFPLFQFL